MLDKFLQLLVLFTLFGFFEFLFPAFEFKGIQYKLRNLIYGSIFLVIGGALTSGILIFLPFQPKMLAVNGLWNIIGIVFLYLFVYDLLYYWYHRAEHYFSFLWTIHELHHSDTELNATSSVRSYWLEQPLQTIILFFPLFHLIGYDAQAVVIFTLISSILLVFTHSNIQLRLGWLTPIICGPQVHRIHHSILSEHSNKNFAQFFPIIDVLFGTFHYPKQNEYPATGVASMTTDESYIDVLFKPFKHWLLRKKE